MVDILNLRQNRSIVNHSIVKRYVQRSKHLEPSNSKSSSTLITVILFAIFIGIPLILFLSNKYNLFGMCSNSNQPNTERSRKKGKNKSKKVKSRKKVDHSDDDDESDKSESTGFTDHYLNKRKHKSDKNKLKRKDRINDKTENKHSETFDTPASSITDNVNKSTSLVSTPVSSEYFNANSIESKPVPNMTNSISSEYAYVVYRPDTNRVAVSRSLNNLIPPNTRVIYKVDNRTSVNDCQIIKSLESNLIASNISSEISPRTLSPQSSIRSNYFIVNSDVLLKQSKNEKKRNLDPQTSNPTNKSTYFLYSTKASDLNLNQNIKHSEIINNTKDIQVSNKKVAFDQPLTQNNAKDPIEKCSDNYLKPALSKKSSKNRKEASRRNEQNSVSIDYSDDCNDKYENQSRSGKKSKNKSKQTFYKNESDSENSDDVNLDHKVHSNKVKNRRPSPTSRKSNKHKSTSKKHKKNRKLVKSEKTKSKNKKNKSKSKGKARSNKSRSRRRSGDISEDDD